MFQGDYSKKQRRALFSKDGEIVSLSGLEDIKSTLVDAIDLRRTKDLNNIPVRGHSVDHTPIDLNLKDMYIQYLLFLLFQSSKGMNSTNYIHWVEVICKYIFGLLLYSAIYKGILVAIHLGNLENAFCRYETVQLL